MTVEKSGLARRALELFIPPGSTERRYRAFEVASFGLGSALCLSWLQSIAGYAAVLGAGLSLALIYWGASSARMQARHVLAGVVLIAHLGFLYVALAFGTLLIWAVPVWVHVLCASLLLISLAGALRSLRPPRLPLCLPLGIWTAAALACWLREDGRIRCDDYLSVLQDPSIRIAIPTSSALARCAPGDVLITGRYPRRIWQPSGSSDIVFTTQPGVLRFLPTGTSVPEELSGSVCFGSLDGSRRPECTGNGKAQGMAESERHDRLFVGGWGRFENGARGALYAFERKPPLRLIAEHYFREQTGELYYDEKSDMLGMLSDEGEVVIPVNAATLTPEAPVPAPVIPGETRYDQALGEGVFCFAAGPLKPLNGRGYAAVAFRGAPFAARPLAPSTRYPSSWLALTWGCDWDGQARRVYVALSNLGLLLTIDYDTGDVLERRWVGLGVRSVAYDHERRRLYLANFLRGRVTEWDVRTARELRSWFVGRFVRYVVVRKPSSLLVSSNLGILEIRL